MYIPIGNDMAVRDRTIIGIFDMDNCSWSFRTRDFLARAEQNGEVIPVAEDLPLWERVALVRRLAAAMQGAPERIVHHD